jgi:hypothetical protein
MRRYPPKLTEVKPIPAHVLPMEIRIKIRIGIWIAITNRTKSVQRMDRMAALTRDSIAMAQATAMAITKTAITKTEITTALALSLLRLSAITTDLVQARVICLRLPLQMQAFRPRLSVMGWRLLLPALGPHRRLQPVTNLRSNC